MMQLSDMLARNNDPVQVKHTIEIYAESPAALKVLIRLLSDGGTGTPCVGCTDGNGNGSLWTVPVFVIKCPSAL